LDARSSTEALSLLGQLLNVRFDVVGDTVTLMSSPYGSNKKGVRKPLQDVWSSTREVGR
jgi:hypothetical protein